MKPIALGLLLALGLTTQALAQEKTSISAGLAVDQQLSAVLEIDDQYRFTLGNDGTAFDYLFQHGTFDNPDVPVDWYVGAGGWAEWDDDYGVRLPIGLDWEITKQITAYGQVHPELNFHGGPELQLGGALGVTYSF